MQNGMIISNLIMIQILLILQTYNGTHTAGLASATTDNRKVLQEQVSRANYPIKTRRRYKCDRDILAGYEGIYICS
jgi:hypothetical protein